ncbi:MAG TPA: pyridoxamine 5'-phosphate oxidase family protein [Chloroflexota bacterium]|nr:pyridoxamine 5'-phosphate oxidase family protein [Chloroflexota bacterium]
MSDPGELLDPVRQYLAAARYAVLATNDPHLVPHQVVVHYRLESTGLLVNGRADRRWVRNLRRDSHVSLLVPDADRPLHFVRIAGTAELIRTGNPAVEDAMTLARRYGEDPSAYPGQDRVSFRIVPRRVYEYG